MQNIPEEVVLIVFAKRHLAPLILINALLAQTSFLSAQSPEIPVPQFQGSFPQTSDAGHVRLKWDFRDEALSNGAIHFELQQAKDPAFEISRTIYTGPDLASFISGLPNGEFHFRVRAQTENGSLVSAWSQPVLLKVQHHSLQLAFTLFGVGAVVFLATLALVFFGNRRTGKESV